MITKDEAGNMVNALRSTMPKEVSKRFNIVLAIDGWPSTNMMDFLIEESSADGTWMKVHQMLYVRFLKEYFDALKATEEPFVRDKNVAGYWGLQ